MGRVATKAVGNAYYEARINAAKWNDKLSSREGAAELLHVSQDCVTDAELGLYKVMPVDLVIRMADLYKAPELLNTYCLHECPIGETRMISDKVLPIERITVKLIKTLRVDQLDNIKDRLIDISEDGIIDESEKADLDEILMYLEKVSRTISELKIIGQKITGGKK